MNSWKITAGLSLVALGLVGLSNRGDNNLKEEINKMQDEVKSYNLSAKEYDALEQNIRNKRGLMTTSADRALGWQKALDSLKTEAACKKAYMEGAQMVRDSIKLATKIK